MSRRSTTPAWRARTRTRRPLRTDSQDDGGKARLLFNVNGADHTYFVEFGGGTTNTVRLAERIGGVDSTIATYGGSYPVWSSVTPRITVRYADDHITVRATRGDTTTTLFDRVADYSLSSGRIGAEAEGTQSFVDDVSVDRN